MGGENVGGYSDSTVDDALERAVGLQNDRARRQLFSYAATAPTTRSPTSRSTARTTSTRPRARSHSARASTAA